MGIILGVDEVGRGCWAGPLVAGAAILHSSIPGLKDSKKLSARQRKLLNQLIEQQASVGLGWVTSQEVDSLGLPEAVRVAMVRAVEQVTHRFDQILVDGNFNFLAHNARATTIIGGDNLVPAISAASIAAKVARDAYMEQAALEYPGYGFDKHVGYGTKQHIEALASLGPCHIHRLSYKPLKAYQ